jgi:uncharacterized protein (TIGR00369 family)
MDRAPDRPSDFSQVPCNRLLGLTMKERDERGATVVMRPRPEFTQEYGVVHGGLLDAVADTAAVYALLPRLAEGEAMTSVEFKVNFLAPADPDGGDLEARATIVKAGRTIRVAQVDVHQTPTGRGPATAPRHVPTGLFTYIVLRK